MAKPKSERTLVNINVESMFPHIGEGRGDVMLKTDGALFVEVEVPSEMIAYAEKDKIAMTPEGIAFLNNVIKKAMFKEEQEYQAWRIQQQKPKSKGGK